MRIIVHLLLNIVCFTLKDKIKANSAEKIYLKFWYVLIKYAYRFIFEITFWFERGRGDGAGGGGA